MASVVTRILPSLSAQRPVFHSEADFQLALGTALRLDDESRQVFLEVPMAPGLRLDMLVRESTGERIAVELKYPTQRWQGTHDGVPYALKEHGAQDLAAYSFINDLGRIERLIRDGLADRGSALMITNDPAFWTPPSHGRATQFDAFRIHEGQRISGQRTWKMRQGSADKYGNPVDLQGVYDCRWATFARRGDLPELRFLAIEAGPLPA